jgi:hypothetical protein
VTKSLRTLAALALLVRAASAKPGPEVEHEKAVVIVLVSLKAQAGTVTAQEIEVKGMEGVETLTAAAEIEWAVGQIGKAATVTA